MSETARIAEIEFRQGVRVDRVLAFERGDGAWITEWGSIQLPEAVKVIRRFVLAASTAVTGEQECDEPGHLPIQWYRDRIEEQVQQRQQETLDRAWEAAQTPATAVTGQDERPRRVHLEDSPPLAIQRFASAVNRAFAAPSPAVTAAEDETRCRCDPILGSPAPCPAAVPAEED